MSMITLSVMTILLFPAPCNDITPPSRIPSLKRVRKKRVRKIVRQFGPDVS